LGRDVSSPLNLIGRPAGDEDGYQAASRSGWIFTGLCPRRARRRSRTGAGNMFKWREIEIDPAQLEAYRAAVREQIEAAVRVEPGVLALYAVSDKDNPAPRQGFSKSIATWMPTNRISHPNISGKYKAHVGEDGQVAQARSSHTHYARCEVEIVARLLAYRDATMKNFIRGSLGAVRRHRHRRAWRQFDPCAGKASRLYDRRQYGQGARGICERIRSARA